MTKSMLSELKFHQKKLELKVSKEKLLPSLYKMMKKETESAMTNLNLLKLTILSKIYSKGYQTPKHKKLHLKPALLQVMPSSKIIIIKSPTLEAPSLTSKPRSENFKTPTTDSKEMPMLLK